MTDTRVCNSADLMALNHKAIGAQFNRSMNPECLVARLDPDGVHVLTIALWGHNLDHGAPLHHRVQILAKAIDTMEPVVLHLDVADTDWKALTTVDAFRAAMVEAATAETVGAL